MGLTDWLLSRVKKDKGAQSIAIAGQEPPTPLKVLETALDLRRMVNRVTLEEFHRQEDRYDRDSGPGRELLFLMANHEWVRATSEIVRITRSDAIETDLKIDIDLRSVTHEAFRGKSGLLWLPVTVLPLKSAERRLEPDPPKSAERRLEPDPFATVTDAAGNLLPLMPDDDLGHQMSAAMAEIIVNMAISHLPGADNDDRRHAEAYVVTRDQRVLLASAIYRLLRLEARKNTRKRESEPGSGLTESERIKKKFLKFLDSRSGAAPEPRPDFARFRMTEARSVLLKLLDRYIIYLGQRAHIKEATRQAEVPPAQFAPELAHRAVKVLQALAASTIIVVPVDFSTGPTVLTVRVPARPLRKGPKPFEWRKPGSWLVKPKRWLIRPSGHLEIDVLLPTADADRQIQIQLADGVLFEEPYSEKGSTRNKLPRLDIAVKHPTPWEDLLVSMTQVLHVKEDLSWRPERAQLLTDLARSKTALVVDTLQYYEVRQERDAAPPFPDDQGLTKQTRRTLLALRTKLKRAASGGQALHDLQKAWNEAALDQVHLFRLTSVDRLDPRTIVAPLDVIEDVAQRATPVQAVIHADVSVEDREYFSTARSSAVMSLIVMTGVLFFLVGWHLLGKLPHPEVLAIVLVLFATIQADRIERPDRSTLLGQLSSFGTWLIAASMLPAVTLALALAADPGGWVSSIWAAACIALQASFLILMWRGPLTQIKARSYEERRRFSIGERRKFETDRLDYSHFEALRSDYWRTTTAEALTLGRMAYGYMVWQGPDAAGSASPQPEQVLVGQKAGGSEAGSNSVLALLHSSTRRQAMTFVVFREERDDLLPSDAGGRSAAPGTGVREAKKINLDPDRLAPTDNVTSSVDVFIGFHGEFPILAGHPLITVLQAARNKLIVLEAQLPFPPPVTGYGARQWARIRIALRDPGDIGRLTDFLGEVFKGIPEPADAMHVVVVRAHPAAPPRIISGPARSGAGGDNSGHGYVTGDLDYEEPAGSADAPAWRMIGLCAEARSNIESDIIGQLPVHPSQYRLMHLNYAILHGTAVIIMLLRKAQDASVDLAGSPVRHSWHEPLALVNGVVSYNELGSLRECPLLGIRFRWQDRPGALLNVLNSVNSVLEKDPPGIPQADRSVSYARLSVATGQVAEGNLTVRIHSPAQYKKDWNRAVRERMAREISTAATLAAAAQSDSGSPGSSPSRPENPVISIDLLGAD